MKNKIMKFGLVFLCCAGLSVAQDWYHSRDDRFRGEGWHPQVFAQVGQDLEHIYSAGAAKDRERQRLERTREELVALQAKLDEGIFDNGTTNDVIDSLRKSANDNRLSPRDRDVLADDASRIHEFQRNHNRWMRH